MTEGTFGISILNSLPAQICVLDATGHIVAVNAAWERFARENGGDLAKVGRGANYLDVCRRAAPETAPEARAVLEGIETILDGRRRSFSCEYPCHSPDQSRWFLMQASPFQDRDLVGVVVAHTSITDRKQYEKALLESEERFRRTFENAAVGMALSTPDGLCLRVNQKLCDITGYGREELLGHTWIEITHPEDVDADLANVRELLSGRTSMFSFQKRYIRKDGGTIWVHLTVSTVLDQFGRPEYCIAIVEDIDDQRRAEIALRDSEERFRATFENAAVGIAHVAVDGRWLRVNRRFCEIVGYPLEMLLARSWTEITHPDDLQADLDNARRLLAGEISTYTMEKRYIRRDRSTVWVCLTVALVRDDHGSPRFFISVIEDITERKALQEELLTIAEREHRRIGQDLHDDVGQELTGIGLMVEALAESLDASGSPETPLVSRIRSRLTYVQHAVRDLSRGLIPVEVDARGLMTALEELANRVGALHGIDCEFVCREPVAIADNRVATQLYRITQEAIANAVRHAATPWIRVSLERVGVHIALEIRDGGVGITPAARDARGMGLRIMRHRAEQVGGTLTVRPADEGGTRVVCIVPGRRADGRGPGQRE